MLVDSLRERVKHLEVVKRSEKAENVEEQNSVQQGHSIGTPWLPTNAVLAGT